MSIDALSGYSSFQYQKINSQKTESKDSFSEKLSEAKSSLGEAEKKEDISLLNRYELMSKVRQHIEMMEEKLENNDIEQKFQIGGMSFTEKEWDKLLSDFDDQEDALKKAVEEEIERTKEQKEYSEKEIESIVAKWLEDKDDEI